MRASYWILGFLFAFCFPVGVIHRVLKAFFSRESQLVIFELFILFEGFATI